MQFQRRFHYAPFALKFLTFEIFQVKVFPEKIFSLYVFPLLWLLLVNLNGLKFKIIFILFNIEFLGAYKLKSLKVLIADFSVKPASVLIGPGLLKLPNKPQPEPIKTLTGLTEKATNSTLRDDLIESAMRATMWF